MKKNEFVKHPGMVVTGYSDRINEVRPGQVSRLAIQGVKIDLVFRPAEKGHKGLHY